MSSINNIYNGYSSTNTTSVANKALNTISEKLSEIESNDSLSDEYKERQVNKLNSAVGTISGANANIQNASNLINGMLGKTDVCDFSNFFSNDISSIRTLVSANQRAQNEARVLAAEISVDRVRGNDTSDKEEKLSNISANTSILSNSLNSQINSVLSDKKTDRDTRAVIDVIKDDLAANQKKLDKEFGKTTDTEDDSKDTKTEETASSSSSKTDDKTSKPSVIDQIKQDLANNQKKLDEEFSAKA